MKRKHFIKTALLAIPTLSFANLLNFDRNNLSFGKSNKKGLIVRSGESRFGGELPHPKMLFYIVKFLRRIRKKACLSKLQRLKFLKELVGHRRIFTNMKMKPFM